MANPLAYRIIQTVNPAVATGTITVTPTNTLVGSLLLVFVGSSAQTGLMTAGGTSPVWDVGLATFVIARSAVNVPYQHISVSSGISRSEVAS